MKSMKKFFAATVSLALSLCMVASAAAVESQIDEQAQGSLNTVMANDSDTASEENTKTGKFGDNIEYSFNETTGALTITGSGPMKDLSLLSYAPWYRFDIHSVSIADGITAIGSYNFENLKNCTEIEIPGSVETIGYRAFESCKKLEVVFIDEGVVNIGEAAFINCSAINLLYLPKTIETIGVNAFEDCDALTEVTIQNGIKSIAEDAFNSCDSLENVYIYSYDAEIYDHKDVFPKKAVIHGYQNSTVSAYAEKYSRTFSPVDYYHPTNHIAVSFVDNSPVLDTYNVDIVINKDTNTKNKYVADVRANKKGNQSVTKIGVYEVVFKPKDKNFPVSPNTDIVVRIPNSFFNGYELVYYPIGTDLISFAEKGESYTTISLSKSETSFAFVTLTDPIVVPDSDTEAADTELSPASDTDSALATDSTTDSQTDTQSTDTAVNTNTDTSTDTAKNTDTTSDTGNIVYGDVDNNKFVNMQDVTVLQKIIAELETYGKYGASTAKRADVTHDSFVNMKDVTTIQKFLADLIPSLG